MAKQLTAKEVQLAKLAPGQAEQFLTDSNGLVLRLRLAVDQSVSKLWMFRYTIHGQRRKLTLGAYPEVSLAAARELAFAKQQELQAGIDPIAAKLEKAAIAHASAVSKKLDDSPKTLAELGNKWLTTYVAANHKDPAYTARVFELHINPSLGTISLSLLRVRHVSGLLDEIHATGQKRTCGVVLSTLRQALRWGMTREYVAGDITAGLKSTDWGGKGEIETRNLTPAEIKLLHTALTKSDIHQRWKHAIWLILATGTRIEETLKAEITHFDLAAKIWVIPLQNQKQTQTRIAQTDHIIFLSDFALIHAKELISLATSQYIFTNRNTQDGAKPTDHKTLSHLINDRQTDSPKKGRTQQSDDLVLPGGKWSPHDLRRTMSTQMGELGVADGVTNRCLNHVGGDVITQTYQRAQARKQMQVAWEKWGKAITKIIEKGDAK